MTIAFHDIVAMRVHFRIDGEDFALPYGAVPLHDFGRYKAAKIEDVRAAVG